MSNINGVENTQKVVTEASANNAKTTDKSAKAGTTGGKELPPEVRSDRPKPRENVAAKSAERVEKAVEQLNDYVQSLQRDLRFSMDEELGRPIVRVVDSQTQEVIRQIPNDVALNLARNLKDILSQQQLPAQDGSIDGNAVEASLGLINTRI